MGVNMFFYVCCQRMNERGLRSTYIISELWIQVRTHHNLNPRFMNSSGTYILGKSHRICVTSIFNGHARSVLDTDHGVGVQRRRTGRDIYP
jgi:hypothetical protein